MGVLVVAAAALGLAVFEGSVPAAGALGWFTPDLWLVLALAVAIGASRPAALWTVVGLGLFKDCLSAEPLGLHGLLYGLAALAVHESGSAGLRDDPVGRSATALAAGLVVPLLHLGLHVVVLPGTTHGVDLLRALARGAGTAVAAVPALAILAPMRPIAVLAGRRRVHA